jgi:hypothetical protein
LRTSMVRSSTRARVFGPRLTGVANRIPAGSHLHDLFSNGCDACAKARSDSLAYA